MRRQRMLVTCVAFCVVLLVGCGTPAPTPSPVPPTPEPTSSPAPPTPEPAAAPAAGLAHAGEEWDYVAKGDTDTWDYFTDYAAHLEADLGASVTVHNWLTDR
ncbi:hypothetical protein ACFLWA_09920 [Chloroflexota bacterium]